MKGKKGEKNLGMSRRSFIKTAGFTGAAAVLGFPAIVKSQPKEIRVGVQCSLTGPLAPAGGTWGHRGVLLAIEALNKGGGVLGKHKIVPVVVDDQSSPDIAARETERLISMEKLEIILGTFSSGTAVPCAAVCEKNKAIWWNCSAVADGVLKDKHYRYVFKANCLASDFGRYSVRYIASNYKQIGFKDLSEIKMASITEDGPYGSYCRFGNVDEAKKLKIPVVFDEAYSYNMKDMSSIILKMKASGQNVILHTGYSPDIILFNKQAVELGLKTKVLVGEGTLYSDYGEMTKNLGQDYVNYLNCMDLMPLQIVDKNKLTPENRKIVDEFRENLLREYKTEITNATCTYGFCGMWILGRYVLPGVVEKFGKVTADGVREVATKIDVRDGQTPMWYGAKFEPPESAYAGQNIKAFPTMIQYIGGKRVAVFPEGVKSAEPVLPLPAGHALAAK